MPASSTATSSARTPEKTLSRSAVAAASAARACATDAVSSSAESSATTSPARTRAPFCTLMAASWPPTSGATRTSVVRTTPTIGAAGSGRQRKYPLTPTTTRMTPNPTMRAGLRLAMYPSPSDEKRGNHRESEREEGQAPEAAPVVGHLLQAGAQLVDADNAVDREIRREYVAVGKDGIGDRFARPGEACHEKLRKARAEEDERRGLRVLEPGARGLAHEAGREKEDRPQREQLQGVTERGKAVEARQHDEVERKRGQIDGQVGDAAAEHACERPGDSLRQRADRQHRRADQQRLLQDQHEGSRHDVAGIPANRVEDRLQQDLGRARGGERGFDQAAIGSRAARGKL